MIDATGYQSLKEIIKTYKIRGVNVILSGIREELILEFEKNNMFSILDREFVTKDITKAIQKAKETIKTI